MATLTTRERMLRTYKRQELDRILMVFSSGAKLFFLYRLFGNTAATTQ